jgi:hypothetical protein
MLLVLTVLGSGCGFIVAAPRDYALDDDPGDGLVIVSFTQPPHERVFWMYRDLTLVPMEGRRFWLLVRDQRESDALFRKHYPRITDTQIETHLMHVIGLGEPLEASLPLTARRAR